MFAVSATVSPSARPAAQPTPQSAAQPARGNNMEPSSQQPTQRIKAAPTSRASTSTFPAPAPAVAAVTTTVTTAAAAVVLRVPPRNDASTAAPLPPPPPHTHGLARTLAKNARESVGGSDCGANETKDGAGTSCTTIPSAWRGPDAGERRRMRPLAKPPLRALSASYNISGSRMPS